MNNLIVTSIIASLMQRTVSAGFFQIPQFDRKWCHVRLANVFCLCILSPLHPLLPQTPSPCDLFSIQTSIVINGFSSPCSMFHPCRRHSWVVWQLLMNVFNEACELWGRIRTTVETHERMNIEIQAEREGERGKRRLASRLQTRF